MINRISNCNKQGSSNPIVVVLGRSIDDRDVLEISSVPKTGCPPFKCHLDMAHFSSDAPHFVMICHLIAAHALSAILYL